jgi:heavy metal sensor kinase
MKFNSIRFKIKIFYTAILGTILVLYTSILYFELYYSLYHDMDKDLVVKAQEISSAINSYMDALESNWRAFPFASNQVIRLEGSYTGQNKVSDIHNSWLKRYQELDLERNYINLVNANGESVVASSNMDEELISYFLKSLGSSGGSAVSYKSLDIGKHKLRMVTVPYYYKNRPAFLQVGASRKPIFNILYGRIFFALITIPFILIFASFLGGALTGRILKPVMDVTNTARNITFKDLSVRVSAEDVDEELKYLVDAFNEMISRLDKSFRYIAEFSSNVAHELKTPLTIIRGESELSLMKERDAAEYKRVIGLTLDETERMFRVVEDLLLLSRLEYQPSAFKFEKIDFLEFIGEIFEQAKKLASKKNIVVQLHAPPQPMRLSCDKLHLRRLFLNLVNNAVKFTPAGGAITIAIEPGAKELRVSVSDTGQGIKPEDINRIFNRFFHIDRGGQKGEGEGTGLGLSIAQSIAKIHRGDIVAASQPGKGSVFTVILPL